jgi:Ubiquitin carboxyl-terminal hydrolase
MSKRFALWRLPPVLVVHLKRFQFDRTSKRKLTNKVDFPLEGLDLSRYLAPTRWDHMSDSADTANEILNIDDNAHSGDIKNGNITDTQHRLDSKQGDNSRDNSKTGSAAAALYAGSNIVHNTAAESNDGTCDSSNSTGQGAVSGPEYEVKSDDPSTKSSNNSDLNRKSNIPKSQSKSKIAMTKKGMDGTLYDLYSVVHHIGALSGGHYVTTTRDRERGSLTEEARRIARQMSRSNSPSVSGTVSPTLAADQKASNDSRSALESNAEVKQDKSDGTQSQWTGMDRDGSTAPPPGGQWWCYNDDVVTEVADPREVTSASAYVLFYMRRDVWGMHVQDIFEESRRSSTGVLLSKEKENTGTITGSTSRTNESSVSSSSTPSAAQKGHKEDAKGSWRARLLPAVVSRSQGPGYKSRTLAPVQERKGSKEGQHAGAGMPPASSRIILRTLAQNHQNFSGDAGDDESSSEGSVESAGEGLKGDATNNDSDKCSVS